MMIRTAVLLGMSLFFCSIVGCTAYDEPPSVSSVTLKEDLKITPGSTRMYWPKKDTGGPCYVTAEAGTTQLAQIQREYNFKLSNDGLIYLEGTAITTLLSQAELDEVKAFLPASRCNNLSPKYILFDGKRSPLTESSYFTRPIMTIN